MGIRFFVGDPMNSYIRLGVAILAASSLSACATITRGTKQKYSIVSEPAGADVVLTTGQKCVTPCKLKLKRKNDFTARITKDGFQPHEVEVESKFSGGGGAAVAGNVLAGGLIGAVVDGTNGSLNSLFPGSLDVKLVPVAAAVVAAPAAEPVAAAAAPAAEAAPAAATTEPAASPMAAPAPAPAPTDGAGGQLR